MRFLCINRYKIESNILNMFIKGSKSVVAIFTSILLFGFAIALQAQNPKGKKVDSVTNQELKKAAATVQDARKIQQQANQKLRKAVKEKGLSFKRFQKIMISKKKPKMADSLNITEEEKKLVKEIKPELSKINQQSKKKLQSVVKDHGLTQKRLQQILMVVRSKPEVAKRFRTIIQEQRKK